MNIRSQRPIGKEKRNKRKSKQSTQKRVLQLYTSYYDDTANTGRDQSASKCDQQHVKTVK